LHHYAAGAVVNLLFKLRYEKLQPGLKPETNITIVPRGFENPLPGLKSGACTSGESFFSSE
jgi:hypothetical protein